MALSNAEKQARWRERNIEKRRRAHRIVNLLMRKQLTDEHVAAVAGLLAGFFNQAGIRTLRRELQPRADPRVKAKEMEAHWRQMQKGFRSAWLAAHPGRTGTEYDRLLRDQNSEVWEWRRARGRAASEAEHKAWERDHPGEQYPEHECSLPDREYTDLERWRRQRAGKAARAVQQAKGKTTSPARLSSPAGCAGALRGPSGRGADQGQAQLLLLSRRGGSRRLAW
jgi:hypothetical protein